MGEVEFKEPLRGRIRRRLMVWGLSLLAAALLMNTFAGSLYTRESIREATARRQAGIALSTARLLRSSLDREIKRLEDMADALMLFPIGGKQQRELVQLRLRGGELIHEIAILDRRGSLMLRVLANHAEPAAPESSYKNAPELAAALAGHTYVAGAPAPHPSEPSWATLAFPLKDRDGAVAGVLTALVQMDFLRRAIADIKFMYGGYAYIVDESGRFIIHSDPAFKYIKRDLSGLSKVRQFLTARGGDVSPAAEVAGISGRTVLSTYAQIPELGWGLILEERLEAVLEESQDLYLFAVVLLAAGLVVGAAIILWLSRRITRPLEQLGHSVCLIRRGDLSQRAQIKTGDEIEDLANEFNAMSAELEQARTTLEQRVEQRTREISALYEITAMVSQTLDVQAVLEGVIQRITELFRFDTTRVYLHDPETEMYSVRGCFEVNPEPWISIASFKRGQSIVGKVVETGEPKIFEDVPNNASYLQMTETATSARAGMAFLAAFPIRTKHFCHGALVFTAKQNRSLQREEVRLLESMAEQIGIAVENSSLYQQARSKTEHLTVLNQVAAALSRSLDLDTVLREAMERVVAILNFDAAWTYMIDRETRQLRLAAQQGLSSKTAALLDWHARGSGMEPRALRRPRPPVFDDELAPQQYRAVLSHPLRPRGYRGSVAMPIKSRGTVIGVLYAANWEHRRYSADDLALLASVAQEIGVAVENAKLFAEIKKQSAELKKINEELHAATQAKSEFIAAMSHELRTPLNIMIGNADIACDGVYGELNEGQKDAMRKISRNGHVLLKMINDLLKLSRVEAKRVAVELSDVNIPEILQHARDQIIQLNRGRDLKVEWDIDAHLPVLVTDAVKLEEIFHNLIGNAFKFTASGRVAISARNRPELERVEFAVSDTGIGIDPADVERIFEKFEQIKSPGRGKNDGVGLGLSIVRKYLELMQGGIRVESARGRGARFVFWLPYRASSASTDRAPALTSAARNG
jgi:signal transduction histidine kinase